MAKMLGARRPAFTRKVLWIAAAAIFLVFAWAKAGFPCPTVPCPWYQMGPDGTLGMMPPTMGAAPSPGDTSTVKFAAAVQRSTVQTQQIALPSGNQGPAPGGEMVLKQQLDGTAQTYRYVATLQKKGVYLIMRDRTPWLTVTYNPASHLYELTDPYGTGSPVLKLGANVPHKITIPTL